jgi:hypothetical protein
MPRIFDTDPLSGVEIEVTSLILGTTKGQPSPTSPKSPKSTKTRSERSGSKLGALFGTTTTTEDDLQSTDTKSDEATDTREEEGAGIEGHEGFSETDATVTSEQLLHGLRLTFTRPGTPKLYVGVEPVGGFTEVSQAIHDGSFEALLDMAGAAYPHDQPLFFNSGNYRQLCRAVRRMLKRVDWACIEGELLYATPSNSNSSSNSNSNSYSNSGNNTKTPAMSSRRRSSWTTVGQNAEAAAGGFGDSASVDPTDRIANKHALSRSEGPWTVRLKDGQIRHHVDASSIRFVDLPGGTSDQLFGPDLSGFGGGGGGGGGGRAGRAKAACDLSRRGGAVRGMGG